MTTLARWLQQQINARNLTQQEVSVYAGVSNATISDILRKGHLPRMETLFRLADFFEAPRIDALRLAARMPLEDSDPDQSDEFLVPELLDEFRKVPDEWKEVAIQQVELVARMAGRPPARIIGDEEDQDD